MNAFTCDCADGYEGAHCQNGKAKCTHRLVFNAVIWSQTRCVSFYKYIVVSRFADICTCVYVDVCCTVSLTITVDNIFYVYHGGVVVLADDAWLVADNVSLDNACVLAVKAVDTGDVGGILASTSTGVVTDASWKCSSGGGVEQTGWYLAGFDDAAWSQAHEIAPNDGSWWLHVVPGINPAAQWIWSQNISDDVIYCRKSLC